MIIIFCFGSWNRDIIIIELIFFYLKKILKIILIIKFTRLNIKPYFKKIKNWGPSAQNRNSFVIVLTTTYSKFQTLILNTCSKFLIYFQNLKKKNLTYQNAKMS